MEAMSIGFTNFILNTFGRFHFFGSLPITCDFSPIYGILFNRWDELISVKGESMKNLKQHIYRPFVVSVTVGALVSLGALLLCAAAVYVLQLPVELCGALGAFSLTLGCFASAYVLGRQKQRRGIKQGFLCGAALFLICFIGSIVFGEVTAGGFFGRLLLCSAAGVVGGVIGVNRKVN